LKELYENQEKVFGFNPWKMSYRSDVDNEIIPMVLIVGCKSDKRENEADKNFVVPKVLSVEHEHGLTTMLLKKIHINKKHKVKVEKEREKEKEERKNKIKNVFHWKKVPNGVLLDIFSYLDAKDLGRAACVCKKWKQVTDDISLSLTRQKREQKIVVLKKK